MEYFLCLYFQGVDMSGFQGSLLSVCVFRVWRRAGLSGVYSLCLYFQGVEMGRFESSIFTVFVLSGCGDRWI